MTATVLSVAWDVFTIVAVVCIVCTSLFMYLTWEDINFSAKDKDEGRPTRVDRRDANGGRSNPSPVPPVLLEGVHYDQLRPPTWHSDTKEWEVLLVSPLDGGRTRTMRERRTRHG